MVKKEMASDEKAVATTIGVSVAKKIGYRHLEGKSLHNIYFLKFSSEGKENKYINLLISDKEDYWSILPVNIIITKTCLLELNEEEHELLFNKGTMCEYGDFYISVFNEITGPEILQYVGDKAPIILDRSIAAKRKTVSNIIQDYFQILEIKRPADDPVEEEYLSKMNVRTQVVERIAEFCREALKCQKMDVKYSQNGTDVNSTILLLGKNNEVFELYAILDETHTALFYMLNDNGNWRKAILPDTIGEIANLFERKA